MRYAGWNLVSGQPLVLNPNLSNSTDGEVLLGTVDNPVTTLGAWDQPPVPAAFNADVSSTTNPPDLTQPHINAVQVTTRHAGAAAHVTAFVDRDVIGFTIQGSLTVPGQTTPAIPVVPIAILDSSWDQQIQPASASVASVSITLSQSGNDSGDNAKLLGINPLAANSASTAINQIQNGITSADLPAPRNGQLLLNDALNQQKNELQLERLSLSDSTDFASLAASLGNITGQQRVWMLYSVDPSVDPQGGSGATLIVVGFVCAGVECDEWHRARLQSSDGGAATEHADHGYCGH